MKRLIHNYDQKKGKQHNVQALMKFSSVIEKFYEIEDPITHWAKVFVFDAVIGNTDRHQDNWGIIFKRIGESVGQGKISPAFDNGTSLGHEILDSNLDNFKNEARLSRYISKGRHHIRWRINDERSCGHFELLQLFVEKYPKVKNAMFNCLNFNNDELKENLNNLINFKIVDRLSPQRCDFITDLIIKRKNIIISQLGN